MTTDYPTKDLTNCEAERASAEGVREEPKSLAEMKMTLDEYKVLSRQYLGGREWLSKPGPREFFQACRQNYLTGGWSEEDLDALAILHMLHSLREFAASEEERTRMTDFWAALPVRNDLKREVWRKAVIDFRVQIQESLEGEEFNEFEQIAYRKRLARAEADALAASLDIFPGTPEYDALMREKGFEP